VLSSLLLFLILEKRNNFSSLNIFLFRFISILFNIAFLFYASRAYGLSRESLPSLSNITLFEYVLIGDLTLRLVCDALVIFNQLTRVIISNGIFDTLLGTKTSFFKIILKQGISSLSYSALFILIELSLLYFIADFSFSATSLIFAILLNLCSLPLFIALGIFNCAFYIKFRRGNSITGILTTLLSATSGAYFPIQVFPEVMTQLIRYLNPFHFIVSKTRIILDNTLKLEFMDYIQVTLGILVIGLLFMSLSHYVLNKLIIVYRNRGLKIKVLR